MAIPFIGWQQEMGWLKDMANSPKSEFVAVYGRRRAGKTFLIRSAFGNRFTFQFTGMANATLFQQLVNFSHALQKFGDAGTAVPESWFIAFSQLEAMLEKSGENRKVIFIDELPWLDTPKSGFIQALEHFWNNWASARTDIVLIVCGSAASWMLNKLIHNKGGLHNRVTKRIKIVPFTLRECEQYLEAKNGQ